MPFIFFLIFFSDALDACAGAKGGVGLHVHAVAPAEPEQLFLVAFDVQLHLYVFSLVCV